MNHAIIFGILCLVTLVFLGSELKQVCRLEKRYMTKVEMVTWGYDREVTK